MKLAPRTGMVVIDPTTNKALPAAGVDVEMSSYWVRRLKDGDVAEVSEEKPTAEMPRARRRTRTKGTDEGNQHGDLIQRDSIG